MSTPSTSTRIALITGSSRGLGRAIALKLAQQGFNVAIHYGRNEEEANKVAEQARDLGVKAVVFGADLSTPANASELVKNVIAEFGGLDILVNNAGITRDGLAVRLKDEDWQSVIDTNLGSAFVASRAAIKHMMRQRSGRIINMASISGLMGNLGQSNYSASKAGLIGLTKALAKEYGSRGITVNAVAPGFIASDMTDKLSDEVKANYEKDIPLGRFGTPEEVAALVAFLCADEAGYISGQVIGIDGGLYPH